MCTQIIEFAYSCPTLKIEPEDDVVIKATMNYQIDVVNKLESLEMKYTATIMPHPHLQNANRHCLKIF